MLSLEVRFSVMSDYLLRTLLSRLSRPLNLVNAGARWGASDNWMRLAGHTRVICFEPDKEECARLNESAQANVTFLPMALASYDGSLSLFVTKEPACSSVYQPIETLYRDYPGLEMIEPESRAEIPCRALDSVLYEMGITNVDAIKLDTQGSELDILKGAKASLLSAAIVDVEVEFNELYANQPLFCDVDLFFAETGFWALACFGSGSLWDLIQSQH
jgi:FkbM family methyltransferase